MVNHLTKHVYLTSIVAVAAGLGFVSSRVAALPIFPGARGFGISTTAGRGGEVIVVVTLRDRGPGSFRDAVENARGPRTVIFEVAGAIDLETPVTIAEPYVTIAGQTAPSPGITLRYNELRIATHDVLVQHLRVRVGPAQRAPGSIDGIQFGGGGKSEVFNVVVDHCSISWAVDENVSFVNSSVRNVTLSNCIIAQALAHSTHIKGQHSMGILVGIENKNISIVGNLIAHNRGRNAKWSGGSQGVFVNNLVYNTENNTDMSPGRSTDAIKLVVEGNHFIRGEFNSVLTRRALIIAPGVGEGSEAYVADNVCADCTGEFTDDVAVGAGVTGDYRSQTRPLWPVSLDALPAAAVYEHVLDHAGARPWDRDIADRRIVESVRDRGGRIVDCVDADTVEVHSGYLASAGGNRAVLAGNRGVSLYGKAYEEYEIEIVAGAGRGLVRRIVDYDPRTLECIVEPGWPETPVGPGENSAYVIFVPCTINAGGWEECEERRVTHDIPADPNRVEPSGYTQLEEWIHSFSR